MTASTELPTIALTLGDIAGIGPEVTVRAVADPRVRQLCRPVIVGDPSIVDRALREANLPLRVDRVASTHPSDDPGAIACWSPRYVTPAARLVQSQTSVDSNSSRGSNRTASSNSTSRAASPAEPATIPDDIADVPLGAIDPRAGRAAYVWLVAATQAALRGEVDAVVTAPLHKVALKLAGHDYPGHTEILAEECGVMEFAMMLYVPPGGRIGGANGLGVAHVTLHTAVSTVPTGINPENIHDTIVLIDGFLKRVSCGSPHIGVCALNPHAGEAGRFGDEESTRIEPAVRKAQRENIRCEGPIPADALMRRAVAGEFDGVVAMYHDQGHIALKLVAFNQAVNVTLGLPIVRTSPSHGTAFDIAGKGIADPSGMIAAIETASRLAMRVNVGR